MKRLISTFLLSVLVLGMDSQARFAEETKETREIETRNYAVAVLPFSVGDDNLKELGPQVTDLITVSLSRRASLSIVERGELNRVLGELELTLSGTVSQETAAKIGHLTGANILITGRVFAVQNELYVVAKIIGVETGRVLGEMESFSFRKSSASASQRLAEKISTTIAEKGETFFARQDSPRSDLQESLAVLVEGRDLPKVSVTITERHARRAALDPAGETEISHLLQELGFELVEAATTTSQPDIEIKGEAFSEFGMRKGNIVSCKGRVEVKVVEHRTGKVIAIDRETAAAVDVSEQIAGKVAIQSATRQISERLVLKIVQWLDER